MAKVLWAADRRVVKDDGTPASAGTLTIRLADTSTTATAYTDRALSTEQSVFTIGSDGYLENRPTIYGADDVGYDAYVSSTGVNGSVAWTIPDLSIAETAVSDVTDSAQAFKNLIANGAFDVWGSTTSWSNISGDNDGDETALGWFFAQPSAASNAVSRQTASRTGARYGLRFGRPVSSVSTNKLRVWGMLPTEAAIRARGQTVTISFNAHKGADFSGGSLGVKIATGTAASEDGDNIESGGFTGHATPLNTAQSVDTATARYEFQATIGATVSELGFQFSYTPSGTAGADDWVQIEDVQIEIADVASAFVATPEQVAFLIEELTSYGRQLLQTSALGGALSISGTTLQVTAEHILAQLLTVDGAGSGLDADLLDGQSSAYYAVAADLLAHLVDSSAAHAASAISYNGGTGISATDVEGAIDELATEKLDASGYTAADVLAKLLTVDGAGSGLDADTLDGVNIGTSGDTVPKNNTANTFSAQNIFANTTGPSLSIQDAMLALSGVATNSYYLLARNLYYHTSAGEYRAIGATSAGYGALRVGVNGAIDFAGASGSLTADQVVAPTWNQVLHRGLSQYLAPAGSAAAPGIASSGDPNTGFEFPGGDAIYIVANGARRWIITTAGIDYVGGTGYIRTAAGSAAVPSFSSTTDTDSGHYSIGANNLGLALGGALAVDYSTSRVQIAAAIDLQRGASPTALTTESVGYLGFGARQAKTLAFTFALADAGKMIELNSASSRIATIPTNASVAFPIDTAIPVENIGAGTLVLTPDSGVTLLNDVGASGAITLNQHHGGVLYKTATNTWRYRGTRA